MAKKVNTVKAPTTLDAAIASVIGGEDTLTAYLIAHVASAAKRDKLAAEFKPLCTTPEQRKSGTDASRKFYVARNILNSEKKMGQGRTYTVDTRNCDKVKDGPDKGKLTGVLSLASYKPSAPSTKPVDRAQALKVLKGWAKSKGCEFMSALLESSDTEIKSTIATAYEAKAKARALEIANAAALKRKLARAAKAKAKGGQRKAS